MAMQDGSNSIHVVPTDPAAAPLLRLIYAAWLDGALTDDEIRSVQAHIAASTKLSEATRADLLTWLQPAHPPSGDALRALLAPIHGDSASVTEPRSRTAVPAPATPASFSVEALQQLTAGSRAATRQQVFDILSGPKFVRRFDLSKEAHRTQVLEQVQVLAAEGIGALSYPDAYGGADDMGRFAVAFETTAYFDISLTIKFGVQFGLFGGSILALGTSPHHDRYLRDAGTAELLGCFAMTELGHGSNVADIETTATYDPADNEFEIHTPHDSAQKNYIGNAAVDGRMAVVFAQLIVDGKSHGVHALLAPIRNADGMAVPGVRIEDCGQKLGLNGVDNGRLWFTRVRVPRENLLNRYADVTSDGKYVSPISSDSKRFFTTIGALVAGRVSIALGALSAMKSGLTIAIRYGDRRRQFGAAGSDEVRLLDYRTHQRKLLLRLASAYALDFALKCLVDRFVHRSDDDQRDVETLAAGLKAYASWANIESLQVCREACGGQGYLSENRFDDLKADTDIFCTFEGDNTVLMQLVVKSLLSDFRRQFEDARPFTLLKFVAARAADVVGEPQPLAARNTDRDHLRDPDMHIDAFRYRERRLLRSLARRLKHRLDQGMDSFFSLVDVQDHVMATAHAHVERLVMEQFSAGVERCEEPAVRAALAKLSALFALSRIEADRGWFLETGYLSAAKSQAIREQVNALCAEIRPDAVGLVDGFGIPDHLLAAPIAVG